MTPILKTIRKTVEQALDRWYEGPAVPSRFAMLVDAWRSSNPSATKGEWETFAKELAASAYRDGYTRGFENAERDPRSAAERFGDPDAVAESLGGWSAPKDDGTVPEDETDERYAQRVATEVNAAHRAYLEGRRARGPSR